MQMKRRFSRKIKTQTLKSTEEINKPNRTINFKSNWISDENLSTYKSTNSLGFTGDFLQPYKEQTHLYKKFFA